MGLFDLLFKNNGEDAAIQLALKNGAAIIDVRSKGEFVGGHCKNAENIPLDELPKHVARIKKMNKPLILCCASGGRSASATQMLKREGVENVYNGGGWTQVERMCNQL
jgi:phage shock protein E